MSTPAHWPTELPPHPPLAPIERPICDASPAASPAPPPSRSEGHRVPGEVVVVAGYLAFALTAMAVIVGLQ